MTSRPAFGRSCPTGDSLTWYVPETEGDNRHLQAWCITVAPPVVRLTPVADFGPLAGSLPSENGP